MIDDAIHAIANLRAESLKLHRLDIRDEREAFYDQRGAVLVQPLPVPPRKHTVHTIESFAAAVSRYAKNATVWCVLDKVTCVLNDVDDVHRCDVVSLPVTPSDCFAVLARQGWVDQETLIDTLRHSLAAATIDPETTLPLLRNLKFSTQTEQSGAFTNSTAKMGKSVASQVTGEGDLPDTVSVEFHPFPSLADEIDVAVVVFCTLFTNPAKGLLKLEPRQGELEKAKTVATRALRDTIATAVGSGASVFVGTP